MKIDFVFLLYSKKYFHKELKVLWNLLVYWYFQDIIQFLKNFELFQSIINTNLELLMYLLAPTKFPLSYSCYKKKKKNEKRAMSELLRLSEVQNSGTCTHLCFL